jgi:two-component sensor histidine kinase
VEKLLAILPEKPQPLLLRYGVTAAMVAVCCALQVAVYAYAGFAGFFLLIPAIFAAGIMFDRGSAFFATFASAGLAAYLSPIGQEPRHAVPLILFVATGIATAFVSEGLRKVLERLTAAQKTADVLMRELDHRTKNNMMTMVALLRLQARAAPSPEVRAALEAAAGRIGHMAQIHSHLEPASTDRMVPMARYLDELRRRTDDMIRGRPIALRLACDATQLPEHDALPIAIIVNELLTNSLKHAFPGDRAGSIEVRLRRDGDLIVSVKDDGVGCPNGKAAEGIGSRLVNQMAAQLRGSVEREPAHPGCVTTVRVPL